MLILKKVFRQVVCYVDGNFTTNFHKRIAAAEDKNLKVAVMTKLVPTRSASTMAQGGMNGKWTIWVIRIIGSLTAHFISVKWAVRIMLVPLILKIARVMLWFTLCLNSA